MEHQLSGGNTSSQTSRTKICKLIWSNYCKTLNCHVNTKLSERKKKKKETENKGACIRIPKIPNKQWQIFKRKQKQAGNHKGNGRLPNFLDHPFPENDLCCFDGSEGTETNETPNIFCKK